MPSFRAPALLLALLLALAPATRAQEAPAGIAAVADRDQVPALIVGSGAAVVAGTAVHGRKAPVRLPPELESRLRERGPEYGEAFRESYADRLRGRRMGSAILGGVTGTAAGVGLLFYFLSTALD